jgi:uncharacterized protein YbcI
MAAPNDGGRALLEVTNAIVGLHHEFYGRGATRGRTIMQENYLVCFMEGIYTKAERTLIDAGKFDAVHLSRNEFQDAMRPRFTAAIEELTGRRVFAFLSQVGIDPDVAAEIFWLEPENDGGTAH